MQGVPTVPVVGDGKTVRDEPSGAVVTVPKEPITDVINRNLPTTTTQYPSQIVTYYSKYVDKVSDVSNDMNISGSLSIRYGEISGGGSGSFVDVETFQNSDMNFLISVKVINQAINVKDQLQFWPLDSDKNRTIQQAEFTNTYGDSFISGFQEGGSFFAVVSIRALDSTKKNEIKASAHLALQVGVGSVDAEGSVELAKSDLQKNSEVNITVNWSGGGQLKEGGEVWDIDTLTEVAVRFPDLVAQCPQRTHAILTKYSALRGYLEWKGHNNPLPLDYELASLYTAELLDVYMSYKVIWDSIHTMMGMMENGTKYVTARNLSGVIRMPQVPTNSSETAWQPGPVLTPFEASFSGLDTALQTCRSLMVRIVREVDEITQNPLIAIDSSRPNAYLRPQVFKELLPVVYVATPALPSIKTLLSVQRYLVFDELSSEDNKPLSQDVTLNFPHNDVPPTVALGIIHLDNYKPGRMRLKAYPQKIGQASATVTATLASDAANDSGYPTVVGSWQEMVSAAVIPTNDELIQAGTYTLPWQQTDTNQPSLHPPTDRTHQITFDLEYDIVPNVVVWLSGFDHYGNDQVVVGVTADDITTTGFTVHFHTSGNELYNASATWIAVPSNRAGIACGNSSAVGTSDNSSLVNQVQGHIRLPSDCFTTPPPTILVAISGFWFGGEHNRRVELAPPTEVTKGGFNWHAWTWSDTQLYDIAIGWIALSQVAT